MGERLNISKMAEKLSDELFAEFFWEKVGPTNEDWPCELPDVHGAKTHPADVAFFYDEPYVQARTYVHCDLKSYAKNSINAGSIQGALQSLAKQITCAETSSIWRERYMHEGVTPNIWGLLFVYNHDGGYDSDFRSYITGFKSSKLGLPRGAKLCVLGPEDVFWLDNVRYEIRQMRGAAGAAALPSADKCSFYYPELDRRARVQGHRARAATIEMLTSPWIVMEYSRGANGRGIVVFYRRRVQSEASFVYLFDYLRHFQLLAPDTEVTVKVLDAVPNAPAIFQHAIHRYLGELGSSDTAELADRIKAIRYSKMTQVVSTFSTVEIGMDYE
jgi:hypothetical protein